jgi:hypothetical protein
LPLAPVIKIMMAPFNAVEEQLFPLANGTDAPDLERVAEDS